jgi:hypothetical protein
MNGIILSLMLSYSLLGWQDGSVPVQAQIAGGYHVGPVYAIVALDTWAFQRTFAWQYEPVSVEYDFRVGVKFDGFDIYLSRFCQHNVDAGSWRYPETMGFSIVMKWSNW